MRAGWLIPVVGLAILVAASAVLMTQPGSGPETPGILATTTRVGDFQLTILSTKAHYAEDEPIEISASLVYVGDAPTVHISHALGPDEGPIGFGIDEPIAGNIRSGTVWATACRGSDLQSGVPLTVLLAVASPPIRKPGLELSKARRRSESCGELGIREAGGRAARPR